MYERIPSSTYETLESAIKKSAEEFGWTAKFENSSNLEGNLIYLWQNGDNAMTLQVKNDRSDIDRFTASFMPPFGNGDYRIAKKYVEAVKRNLNKKE